MSIWMHLTSDVCGGECRSWTVEYPSPFSPERPKFRFRGFAQTTNSAQEG